MTQATLPAGCSPLLLTDTGWPSRRSFPRCAVKDERAEGEVGGHVQRLVSFARFRNISALDSRLSTAAPMNLCASSTHSTGGFHDYP